MNMHIRNLQEQSTRIYPVNMHEFYRCINYRYSHHRSLVMHRAQFYRCGHDFTSEFRNIKGAEHRSRCISELNRSNRSNNNASSRPGSLWATGSRACSGATPPILAACSAQPLHRINTTRPHKQPRGTQMNEEQNNTEALRETSS